MKPTPFDFTNLKLFEEDVPHRALAALRKDSPVYWNRSAHASGDDGFWLITKHEDVVRIERNTQLFSSHHGLTLVDSPPATAGAPWCMIRDGLTHLDPPDHEAHRKIVAAMCTQRAVSVFEDRIRNLATEIIDRACALRSVNFASEVALRFPVYVVLGEVLGLPSDDFEKAVNWSDFIVAPSDPEFPPGMGPRVIQQIYDYAMSVFASRRRQQRNDFLGLLATSCGPDKCPMTDQVFARYFWSLFTGAFDTTASAIAGGMLALIQFPQEYQKLTSNPALVSSAVEEILRWETPTIYFRRTATADTEIRRQPIRRGQRIVMCYAAANRDEDIFDNPETFDVQRKPNEHLSFGFGPHYCLGANLARLEIRLLFEEIVNRRLVFRLRGKVQRALSNFQNRIKYMPVEMSCR